MGGSSSTVTVSAANIIDEEHVGYLQILKEYLSGTSSGSSGTFTFDITITGTFMYGSTYYEDSSLTLTASISGESSWLSSKITWYDEDNPPSYTVEERETDGWVLDSSSGSSGTIVDMGEETSSNYYTKAIFINEAEVPVESYINIDKRINNNNTTEPVDGEVFYAKVTITGYFTYNGTTYSGNSCEITVTLNSSNNWEWTSNSIVWTTDEAPTYTVVETSIPDNYSYVSTADQNENTTSNDFSSTLVDGTSYVVLQNKENTTGGNLRIIKLSETDDIVGEEFRYTIEVTGTFTYNGVQYTNQTLTIQDTIKAVSVSDADEYDTTDSETVKTYEFEWLSTDDAPTYTVTETISDTQQDDGIEFVSISNNTKTITASPTISGSLIEDDIEIVKIINRGPEVEESRIQIVKQTIGDIDYFDDNDLKFTFLVEITGEAFTYNGKSYEGTYSFYATVNAKGSSEGTNSDTRTNVWESEIITWDDDVESPTYTVTEVNLPDYTEFVCWSSSTQTVTTSSITGDIVDDGATALVATNRARNGYGYITVTKEIVNTDRIETSESFNITVTITGDFEYNGSACTSYTTNFDLTAGETWTSGLITWDGDEAPTYTVTENLTEDQESDGFYLVSIVDNNNGTMKDGITSIVKVINDRDDSDDWYYGSFQIYKEYEDVNGNLIEGTFTFLVTEKFNGKDEVTYPITITTEDGSGKYWRSATRKWRKGETAPSFSVTEVEQDGITSSISGNTGSLTAGNVVTVTAKNVDNNTTGSSGTITIVKQLEFADKISVYDVSSTFTFQVSVSGTFSYEDESGNISTYNDETMTIKCTVNNDSNWQWTSGTISWSKDAPTYAIEEMNLPAGWYLKEISNSTGTMSGNVTATCTNYLPSGIVIEFTMDIGGTVWDDTVTEDEKLADSYENGVIDADEKGIAGVKVTVYRTLIDSDGVFVKYLDTTFVYADDGVTLLSNVTYTDANGNWAIYNIAVPTLSEEEQELYGEGYLAIYDIQFEYDGQTYEPTTYLSTRNYENGHTETVDGSLNLADYDCEYIDGGTGSIYNDYILDRTTEFRLIDKTSVDRDYHSYDSKAVDSRTDLDRDSRDTYNNYFAEITGVDGGEIDVNGDSTGTTNAGVILNYTSTDSAGSDTTKKISTLESYTDSSGEELTMTASTMAASLGYPFISYNEDGELCIQCKISQVDYLTDDVPYSALYGFDTAAYTSEIETYVFTATYNYMKTINLGLIEREYADVSIEKDLTEAIVVINGKVLKYQFGSALDLSTSNADLTDILYRQILVSDANIEYTLGIYESDYYYRQAIYSESGTVAGSKIASYLSSTYGSDTGTELEIYLTYTITVHNESETYNVTINSISDYYDSTLTMISSASTYVETLNGESVNDTVTLVSPTLTSWSTVGTVTDSDGVTYTEATCNLGVTLAAGAEQSYTVCYKVNKSTYNGISNCIELGEKHNIVEITSFSSYYSSTSQRKWGNAVGDVAGRVDKDSAPDNVNIAQFNDTSYYEDDTDSAPILDVELYSLDREVSGLVWEDAETDEIEYSQTVGNGYYNADEGDETIADLTTEIVEVVSIYDSSTGTYEDVEFIWPTSKALSCLGGRTYESLTGFDSEITTDSDGNYSFTAIPAGVYKIRFVYGDKFVATGNEDDEVTYNGQDYKSTTYQAGFDNDSDNDGYVDDEWYDFENEELTLTRVSDAKDDEARRLVVAAQSEMLIYENTSVLELADEFIYDSDGNIDESAYSELFGDYQGAKDYDDAYDVNPKAIVTADGYYMYAETAKLDLEIEFIYDLDRDSTAIAESGVTVVTVDGDIDEYAVQVGNEFAYLVENIDFGLEERSRTELTLDKQIKEITLTTSDGEVILDAVYDIVYDLGDDDTIRSSVTLNKWESTGTDQIASLNRTKSTQGYRYIMAEGTILQGATINVLYQLTVFNVGEADTCNQILKDVWEEVKSNDGDLSSSSLYQTALSTLTTNIHSKDDRLNADGSLYDYGLYFGSIYYLGPNGTYSSDTILVESTIHEIIDYVDPDVEFIDTDNISENQAWSTTTIDYLISNGLIDPEAVIAIDDDGNPILIEVDGEKKVRTYADGDTTSYEYTFISDEVQEYITDTKTNVILNVDDYDYNSSLVKETVPYTANYNYDEAVATITLQVSRYYSSEEDANEIDNVAEIIKVENTVGRRDIRTVAGNMITYQIDWDTVSTAGYTEEEYIFTTTVPIYDIAGEEPDSSATEVITLTPPTGSTVDTVMKVLAIIGFAGVIIALVIVVIKKKILRKQW